MKLTKNGEPRKPRTRDNTIEMFPELMASQERLRRVSKALKAVRKAMEVGDTWPVQDVAMLVQALQEHLPGDGSGGSD